MTAKKKTSSTVSTRVLKPGMPYIAGPKREVMPFVKRYRYIRYEDMYIIYIIYIYVYIIYIIYIYI